MTDPTIGLKLPMTSDSPSQPASMSAGAWGERAEALGYDSLWVSEAWGVDALLTLAEVAVRTERIRCGTAIVNTYSRTPPVLAMAGATLQQLSGGRAVLGVGASHESIVEPLHAMEYDRPVRRTHEAIELVKRLTGGEGEISYRGEVFQVEGYRRFETPVPVYNAALGAANRRATGRVADGWLPYLFPVSALDGAFETIADTARERGRDPDDIKVTPQILAAVDDDPDAATEPIREFVAWYVGTFPNYRRALARWYPDATEAIGEAWTEGGLDAATAAVTDELLFDLGVAGTPKRAREQLAEILNASVVDCPIVYVPLSVSPDGRDRTIEALRPARVS